MRNCLLSGIIFASTLGFSGAGLGEILTVGGTASVSIPATKASAQMGVQYKGNSAEDIQGKVKKSGNQLLDYLKKMKVENLSSSEYRITTRHNYNQKNKPVFTGSASYSFSIPLDKVGLVVDGALKNGANQITRLEFTASPQAIHKAQKLAQAKAAENALDLGKSTLKSLGLEYKGIKKVQLDGHHSRPGPATCWFSP